MWPFPPSGPGRMGLLEPNFLEASARFSGPGCAGLAGAEVSVQVAHNHHWFPSIHGRLVDLAYVLDHIFGRCFCPLSAPWDVHL